MDNLTRAIKIYRPDLEPEEKKPVYTCEECGKDFFINNQVILDEKNYCPECAENYEKCCQCSEYHKKEDGFFYNDDFFCEECKEEHFQFCEQCEEYQPIDDFINVCDHFFCSERCANRAGFYECADCQEWFNSENGSWENENHDTVCEHCACNYYTCEDCGEIIHQDNSYYSENRGCTLCESCYNDSENNLIKDYSFQPQYNFNKLEWENTLFLGLEIELEAGEDNNREEKTEKVLKWLENRNLQDKVYFKNDGSLDNGVEIVFHPYTLQTLHKKFPLKEFFSYLAEINFSGYNNTCGFHVHLNKKHFLNDENIFKGKIFFYKCQQFLKKFSKRKDFHYCQFPEEMPQDGTNGEIGRYSALNTSTGKKTIEIRIFKSTTNYKRILASIQFCDAFANYILEINRSFLINTSSKIIWQNFIDWCKQKNQYQQFIKYILINSIV